MWQKLFTLNFILEKWVKKGWVFFLQICIYLFVNYIKFIESFQCWVKKLVKKYCLKEKMYVEFTVSTFIYNNYTRFLKNILFFKIVFITKDACLYKIVIKFI